MVYYRNGDVIEAFLNSESPSVITHGCNCFNTMGAGIAKSIKKRFPCAYNVDKKTQKGDRSKLGTITYCKTKNGYVVNAYTQFTYWDRNDMLSYEAVRLCM